jgi:2,3-bisphosphoglycerate-independent phosphoglycerate mutase
MSNRKERTFDRLPNSADHEGKHFQQFRFRDIHSRECVTLGSMASCSQIQEVSTMSELEKELINGLSKLQIQDVEILPEKIQGTEERIKDHPKHQQLLKQLKGLTLLNEEITKLKSTRSVDEDNGAKKIDRLEQELVNGLAKLSVEDVKTLPEKIQQTEQRIKEYQEEEQILEQLKDLTLLHEKITELKYTRPVEGNIE